MTTRLVPRTRSLEIPFKVRVGRAAPDFERARRNEIFYEFTGRVFRGDNQKSGAYAPDTGDAAS